MTLKGNLEVLNLSDIFQSLTLNKHTGTLVVSDGRREKLIYFSEGEIALFSSSRKFKIGDMLVNAGKLAREDLDFALGRQDEKNAGANTQALKLGDILVEEGFVTREDVDDIVKMQIEEEIYDLFLWKKADFEFLIDYCPDRLRRPSCNVTRLHFRTNSLIMEAARRLDEWDVISREIPSLHEVYRLKDRSPESLKQIDLPQYVRNEALRIDGYKTVELIAEESTITRFVLCRLLYDLKQLGLIEPIGPQELSERADELFQSGEYGQAAGLYERLAEMLPQNVSIRRQFAESLRAAGEDQRALEQYEVLAERLQGSRDRTELKRALTAILDLDPDRDDIHLRLKRLSRMYAGRSVVRVAIYVLVLAPLAVGAGLYGVRAMNADDLKRTFAHLFDPEDGPAPVSAAERSARELYAHGRDLMAVGRYEEAWHELRKIIDIHPNTETARLVSLPLRVESDPPGMQVFVNDVFRGRTPHVVRYLPSDMQADLRVEIREGDRVLWKGTLDPNVYHEVIQDLKKKPLWTYETGGPIRTKPVFFQDAAYFTSLDGRLYGVRTDDHQVVYQASLREGDLDPIGEVVSPPALAGSRLLVSTLDGNVLVFDLAAKERRPRVRVSEEPLLAGPAVAADGRTALLCGYAGDLVFYDLQEARLITSLPLCVNRVVAPVQITEDRIIVASTDNRIVALDPTTRKPVWQHVAGEDYRAEPAVYEHRTVLAGDKEGVLVALKMDTGERLWTVGLGAEVAGIAAARGYAVVATRTGVVHGIDVASGKTEWVTRVEGHPRRPVMHGRSVYILTDEGALHAIDFLDRGASVWVAQTGEPCRSQASIHGGRLFFGTEAGRLYCFPLE